ncbi:MAG TPA: TetR/AcrR family transcriptional regulator [Candidatus Sulfotelmatobacter sp.]|nr:TetR/AcrR family transcriptional regulator [Candidatus Sulfotelmatobacter sp.]
MAMRQRAWAVAYAGNGNGHGNGKRPPGRPRSEKARLAILQSTLKLLEEIGFADLTIEEIAARAEVGKATVYRWWPDKGALIADAFASSATRHLRFPDTGSLYKDMSRQMGQLVKVLRSRKGRIVSAILAAGQSDKDLIAAFRDRFLWPRRRDAYETLQRGIRRGELPRNTDLDLLLDSLYGPIYMRFLIRHDQLSAEFVDRLCALILRGARAGHKGLERRRHVHKPKARLSSLTRTPRQ